jgi:hypothetical protein
MTPYLDKFIFPETHFIVFDYGKNGVVFDETDPGYSRKDCIKRLADGDYNAQDVLAVYKINGHERPQDVTEDIAREVLKTLLADPFSTLSDRMPEFIARNVWDAEAIIREHMVAA